LFAPPLLDDPESGEALHHDLRAALTLARLRKTAALFAARFPEAFPPAGAAFAENEFDRDDDPREQDSAHPAQTANLPLPPSRHGELLSPLVGRELLAAEDLLAAALPVHTTRLSLRRPRLFEADARRLAQLASVHLTLAEAAARCAREPSKLDPFAALVMDLPPLPGDDPWDDPDAHPLRNGPPPPQPDTPAPPRPMPVVRSRAESLAAPPKLPAAQAPSSQPPEPPGLPDLDRLDAARAALNTPKPLRIPRDPRPFDTGAAALTRSALESASTRSPASIPSVPRLVRFHSLHTLHPLHHLSHISSRALACLDYAPPGIFLLARALHITRENLDRVFHIPMRLSDYTLAMAARIKASFRRRKGFCLVPSGGDAARRDFLARCARDALIPPLLPP
jgi:hypothetical protein